MRNMEYFHADGKDSVEMEKTLMQKIQQTIAALQIFDIAFYYQKCYF